MALTFLKDAPLLRINLINITGTFIVQEFFTDDSDSTKQGEVVDFVNDSANQYIDYILVGSNATQFVNGDNFTGDGGGTATIDSVPVSVDIFPVHVIQVDSPTIQVTIQELLNDIRDFEDEIENLDHASLANASGKQDLGGGVLVGLTLELLDNWRIQFEARPGPTTVQVSVTGGNLVATNDFGNNPIKPSSFTQVVVTSSSSATIAELQIIDLVHRIESLRSSHSRFGRIIYWDPIGGNDGFEGDSPDRALLTFAAAHTLAVSDAGDSIYCLTKSAMGTGVVNVNEQIIITKNAVSVRGPGASFRFNQISGSGPTITIQASRVELSGFEVTHTTGAATVGIVVDGSGVMGAEAVSISNIFVKNTIGHGISINDSGDSKISNTVIEDVGSDGINIDDNVDDLVIMGNTIDRSGSAGVNMSGSNILDTIFETNRMHDNGTYGIRIGAGTDQTVVLASNFFFDNTIDNILEVAGSQNVTIEPSNVFDSLISDHTVAESFGKRLTDRLKLKRTKP